MSQPAVSLALLQTALVCSLEGVHSGEFLYCTYSWQELLTSGFNSCDATKELINNCFAGISTTLFLLEWEASVWLS